MSLKKEFLKTKPICKVTFTLPKAAAKDASDVRVIGDFNNWDFDATPMKKQKNGSFTAVVRMETGHEYQFRYLLDSTRWENDWQADRYVPSPFGDADNSVVVV